jgi:hypothetical protein
VNHSLRIYFLFGACVAATACISAFAGYGDVSGGLPSWRERQILVLTNACRMAPRQYRDAYVGNYPILDSARYPSVAPLFLSGRLNAAAHAHALDMGDTCGTMAHNSCNGTSWDARIKSYYTASSTIGENIAVGNADPFATMNQWIMDTPQGSSQPAADFSWCKLSTGDSTRCDGHRSNIMNKQYRELGTGYAYGAHASVRNHHFWVQDFGGGKPPVSNPIVGGTHFMRETGKTTFLANYWDQSSKAPLDASVFIDGQKTGLTLAMGTANMGTYQAALARGAACRIYYFLFTDGSGGSWRYPEQGVLVTAGEGGCTTEYDLNTGMDGSQAFPENSPAGRPIGSRMYRGYADICIKNPNLVPQSTSIVDPRGITFQSSHWSHPEAMTTPGGARFMRMDFKQPLCKGVYFLVHRFPNGAVVCEKMPVVR